MEREEGVGESGEGRGGEEKVEREEGVRGGRKWREKRGVGESGERRGGEGKWREKRGWEKVEREEGVGESGERKEKCTIGTEVF